MIDNTPKVQEFPGIPGKLKEASLDEYMIPLSADHLARRQLADLRQAALDGSRAQAALIKLLEENNELKEQMRMLLQPTTPAEEIKKVTVDEPGQPTVTVELEAKPGQPLRVKKPKAP